MALASNKKNVRDFYNKTAQQWADRFYDDDCSQPVLEAFMAMLPDRPRVLDLCCGAGYDSKRLTALGASVVGLDLSEVSIEIARSRNPEIPFYVGNMLEDYSCIGAVDAAVCIAGFVHLRTDELRQGFERLAQVVQPGGLVLLVIRDGAGRIDRMSDVEIDGEWYDRAFYAHNLEELREHAAGLFIFERTIDEPEESVWVNYVFRRTVETKV